MMVRHIGRRHLFVLAGGDLPAPLRPVRSTLVALANGVRSIAEVTPSALSGARTLPQVRGHPNGRIALAVALVTADPLHDLEEHLASRTAPSDPGP